MAGARAAASFSLTITVALATIAVVGGILAGPSIRDCSRVPGHFGACLHDKLQQGGLLPAAPKPAEQPILSSEMPPPIVAETPHGSGWIEANATEYETPQSATAALSGLPGLMHADGLAPPALDVKAEVALAAPQRLVETTGSIAAHATPAADAALSASPGRLDASGDVPSVDLPGGEIALADPAGQLRAVGTAAAPQPPAEAMIAALPGRMVATGSSPDNPSPTAIAELVVLTPASLPAGQLQASGDAVATSISAATLLAPMPDRLAAGGSTAGAQALTATAGLVALAPALDVQPLPDIGGVASGGSSDSAVATLVAEPAPVAAEPLANAPQPKPRPVAGAAPAPAASTPLQPKAIIKFDRRYPDVVVLPPPNTGGGSSFATLQLR